MSYRGGGGGRGGRGYYRGGGGHGGNSGNWRNNNQQRGHQRAEIAVGMKGFLCSTNFRERDCVREAYNLLNEYLSIAETKEKEVEGESEPQSAKEGGSVSISSSGSGPKKNEEEEDIDDALKSEIKELKNERFSERKFNAVDTGVPNLVFINTSINDPTRLAHSILEDIAAKQEQKSKFLVRMVPIEIICRANTDELQENAKEIFPKYFKEGYKSFQIVFRQRYSNKADRDDVIKVLAEIVMLSNPTNVVDLKNPRYTIIVEIIKNLCMLGVVPDYNRFKKYNLLEVVESISSAATMAKVSKVEEGEPTTEEITSNPSEETKPAEKEVPIPEEAKSADKV